MDIKGGFHHSTQTTKRTNKIYLPNPDPYIFSQGIRSNSHHPFLRRGTRSFQPAKMEKRMAEYSRFYDDNFYFNHRWDREVWCQSCKIYHGMREEAKKKCEERKKAAEEEEEEEEERLLQEEEERLLQERRSNSPRYHDLQERPFPSHEESPEEMAPPPPPSPPRVNHAAEAWAFYLEREEQNRKESAGTTELETEPQKGSRPPQLRSSIPVSQPREDITSPPQYPYGTPSIFQNQPSVAPNPAQHTVQNRPILNPHSRQQKIHKPSSAVPISESPSGAIENLQRLPPINTDLFGPTPDIPLRNHGFKPQQGPSEAGPRFRPGPSPYLDLPEQHESPAAISNRSDDNQRGECYFSPYGASEPPPRALPKQSGRSRQAGISRPHHASREQKSEPRKRPSAATPPKPLPLTADQSEKLSTVRNLKRKASLSVNDLLCADGERVDTVGFADDQAPARASTRRRLSSPSSSSAAAIITPRPHGSPPYTFQFVSEKEEKDVEEQAEEEGADDEDEDVAESG